jgi:uncharacterized protein (DUF302 family)
MGTANLLLLKHHIQSTKDLPMIRYKSLLFALLLFVSSVGFAADGLIAVKSTYTAKETMDRFEENAKLRGLNIFARIDHAAGAAKVGKTLRPTEVLIFGNPQGGTPFIECAQTVGIDLPLKALVWEDSQGNVWLGYNDPAYLAQRHGAAQCPAVGGLSKAMSGLVEITIAR